jgi:hypothetical protein
MKNLDAFFRFRFAYEWKKYRRTRRPDAAVTENMLVPLNGDTALSAT